MGYAKFSKRFITRLQDDLIAVPDRLNEKRCEDLPHSNSEVLRE